MEENENEEEIYQTFVPPDEDAHDLRAQRVNYQCYVYRSYARMDAPPSPSNYGWTIAEGKIYILASDFSLSLYVCMSSQVRLYQSGR